MLLIFLKAKFFFMKQIQKDLRKLTQKEILRQKMLLRAILRLSSLQNYLRLKMKLRLLLTLQLKVIFQQTYYHREIRRTQELIASYMVNVLYQSPHNPKFKNFSKKIQIKELCLLQKKELWVLVHLGCQV